MKRSVMNVRTSAWSPVMNFGKFAALRSKRKPRILDRQIEFMVMRFGAGRSNETDHF